MLRFIGLLVVVAGAFGLGYVTGQMPVNPLSDRVKELSKQLVEKTLGAERDFRNRQGLLDAKAHLLQAKLHVIDRNFGTATKELDESIEALDHAAQGAHDGAASGRIRSLALQIREVKAELAGGKKIAPGRLDELHRGLDSLL
ncbi:MAG: hypothetical protein U0172_05785 [Nitrospiraceae bacterium]